MVNGSVVSTWHAQHVKRTLKAFIGSPYVSEKLFFFKLFPIKVLASFDLEITQITVDILDLVKYLSPKLEPQPVAPKHLTKPF
jgi:hypothetical protein